MAIKWSQFRTTLVWKSGPFWDFSQKGGGGNPPWLRACILYDITHVVDVKRIEM